MNWLRKWVLHNWHLKLASLAIAFVLWAAYTAEPMAEVGYLVPLEFHNIPTTLELAGEVPTQVRVRLRGRSVLLRRLTPADLAITVDLADSAAGEQLVNLVASQIDAPPGAEVTRITPSEIRLRLAPRTGAR